MKVAIVGYGKMGKEIESILVERGHEIHTRIGRNDSLDSISGCDVAIEFTRPEHALKNIRQIIDSGIPLVCGTTGWYDSIEEVEEWVLLSNAALVHASNFSLGVQLFFELNRKLSLLMQSFKDYRPSITEIHHTEKLDAPSGTALSLYEDLAKVSDYRNWHLGTLPRENSLPIEAIREMDVKGTHRVKFSSEVDEIEITHNAHSRKGFALGAVIAAEWVLEKRGTFTMRDVLGI
ncbi:MAG: 4-hydroxy-tetrahydrodipicolinate reductase [Nonlabens sp.]